MRTAPAGLNTWLLANNVSFRADLLILSTTDGNVYRWTGADTSIASGGQTYLTAGTTAPLVRRGRFRQSRFPVIDTLDLTITGGPFLISGKSLPLQAALGYFDGARLQLDHLVGASLGHALTFGPIVKFFEGRVAGVDPDGPSIRLTVESEVVSLNQELPKIKVQPQCSYAVYDAGCGLSRAGFTLTGTASGVPTTTTVPTATAGLTAKAAGWFDLGVLTFTSGALSGVRRKINRWTANTFTLAQPLPSAPAAGDALSVYPGCDLTKAKCGPEASLGTITGGNTLSATSTTAAIIARANGYFVGADFLFTSGTQNGQRRIISAFTVSAGVATFTWTLALPGSPTNGDSISVAPAGVFNNWAQFRGMTHVPAPEAA